LNHPHPNFPPEGEGVIFVGRKIPLPLRGRDRVGVLLKFSVISVSSVADFHSRDKCGTRSI
jgi:hypothetical protein